MAPRAWWREYFYDHPLYSQKDPSSFSNTRRDKIKVYCKPCMDDIVGRMISSDEAEVDAGTRFSVRAVKDLELLVFSVGPNDASKGWLESRSETLLQHLRTCELQISVRQRAINTIDSRKQKTVTSVAPPVSNIPPRLDNMDWQHTSPFVPNLDIPHLAGSSNRRPHSFPSTQLPTPRYPSALGLSMSPSPSPIDFDFEERGRPPKRLRTHTFSRHPSYAPSDRDQTPAPFIPFSPEMQAIFEEKIVRLTASASFPLSWVDNPEWISFCEIFVPGATPVTRRILTSRILPTSLKYLRAEVRKRAQGKEGTVQADGWTGDNNHHLVAFMLTADHEIYTVRVEDTTTDKKTAENLLALMIKIMQELKDEWGVEVIAFTTDASGESLKARKLLGRKFPHLVVPDCYAHQINLIVGNYFKANAEFLVHSTRANELITWLRKKSAILGLIREALQRAGKTPLSVIRPVPTRWTAFYLAYRRLLNLRVALEAVVSADALLDPKDRHIISGKKDARERAAKMVDVIKDGTFWHALVRIKHHLAPLAIAANITQSSFCRLDEVLMTFTYLYMEYSKLTDTEDAAVREALLKSINQRWMKSDQDAFIAAVILNPFLKIAPFKRDRTLITNVAIYSLLARLWKRFYKEDAPHELYTQLNEYLNDKGEFAQVPTVVNILKVEAERNKKSPDPLELYNHISIAGEDPIPLVRLARRLFSICPNSASCERLFSTFGLILTKLRSRLGNQNLLDLAELKMHIRDEHVCINTKEKFRKRGFGVRVEANPQVPGQSGPHVDANASVPGQSGSQTETVTPTATEAASDSLPDNDKEPADSASMSTRTLRGMTANLINLADQAADDNDDDDNELGGDVIYIHLQDLFDYTKDHWVRAQQASAVGSLEEEEALYQLLDLDADGDLDTDLDPDLDDSTENILTL